MTASSARPLAGITVIALEQAVAAPLCTVRLVDGGARVIKVERPGGETARHYDSTVHGHSAYFAWLNRGKESVELDLKSSDDFELLCRMLKRADVLVQNLLPGALSRLGLSPEVLAEQFPRLIVASIVGYGQDTPYADMRAYDLLVQAETGLCAVTGTVEEPAKVGVSAADIATGMNAHALILEALIARSVSGRGTHLEVSMFDSVADWMTTPLLHLEQAGRETGRFGMRHASIYPYGSFGCADGEIVIAVQTDDEWRRLCEAMERTELLMRDEFRHNAQRVAHRAQLDTELQPWFASRAVADVVSRVDAAGVAWSIRRELADVGSHPALRRVEVHTPEGKSVLLPRPAGRDAFLETNAFPSIGQHTDAIRAEFGGV
jgi:itaconate CoA-transferase